MKILIVEDDPFKLSQLERRVAEIDLGAEVTRVMSLQEAMGVLEQNAFDCVLLDMAIPSHSNDNGAADVYSQPVGGLDILLYLAIADRSECVVIMTQYPTVEYNREHVQLSKLQEKLRIDNVENVRDVILFAEDGAWRNRLADVLGNLR